MFRKRLAMIVAACLVLAPVQSFAQNAGGTPLPPRPGDRAAPTGAVGGSALPASSGQRVGVSGTGGTALPPDPGAIGGTSSTGNGVARR
ncbi:hypothetical protein CI1B_22180 [Bradyrhizobium ivorense]|uniref:Uncharacterized protein n=1 Tax=Bradyrhizobium ivorense TaxID=2511166 RepID=A0A508SZR4_9BRAD|nr:hypothetical protein [Bradyrhizobium ivorense]VIO67900.1 hypothetical protein CI41S_12740 [Bradyrhizobium ivorense]VIO68595.1 hypothetical protein CI1B_22180 [Bradyrhizobium ivorense]